MINPIENAGVNDPLALQVSKYFIQAGMVDFADTTKEYVQHISDSNKSSEFNENEWVSVYLNPVGSNIASWTDSFIYVKMQITASISKALTAWSYTGYDIPESLIKTRKLWIGYKDSMQAIDSYQFCVNNDPVYFQQYGVEEAYISDIWTPESVKLNDTFSKTKHKDVWDGIEEKTATGAWIQLGDYVTPPGPDGVITDKSTKAVPAGNLTPIEIELKIPVRRFFPFARIKYVPGFTGALELKLRFSRRGLVVGLPSHRVYVPLPSTAITFPTIADPGPPEATKTILQTNGFVQIGKSFEIFDGFTGTKSAVTLKAVQDCAINVYNMKILRCKTVIYQFNLKPQIYQSLAKAYTSETNAALVYTCQTMVFHTLNASGSNETRYFRTAVPFKFTDSLFVLMPLDSDHCTVFPNPLGEIFQFSAGRNRFPDTREFSTYSPMMMDLALNACNKNNEGAAFNEDVRRTLTTVHPGYSDTLESDDKTNFFFGFPLEPDYCFQQGPFETSDQPIELYIRMKPNSPYVQNKLNTTALLVEVRDVTMNFQINMGDYNQKCKCRINDDQEYASIPRTD